MVRYKFPLGMWEASIAISDDNRIQDLYYISQTISSNSVDLEGPSVIPQPDDKAVRELGKIGTTYADLHVDES